MTSKKITNSNDGNLHNDPNKSYFIGIKTKKTIELTIGQQLDKVVQQSPNQLGLIVKYQDIYWTYSEYYQRIIDFSAGLLAIGIKPGDRVAIWANNSMEWCVGQFATAKIGAIMVCINPAYGLHELSYALKKVGCKVLITAKAFKSSNYLEMLQTLLPELENNEPGNIQSKKLPLLTSIIRMGDERTKGMFNFSDIVAKSNPNLLELVSEIGATLSPYEPINIQFTSGTTGEPKGATLTHHSILNNGFQVGEQMRLSPNDRLCIPVPLYHCFGMVMGNLACLTHASTAVFPSEAFEPRACLEAVSQYKCTALHGVPTMFIALLNEEHFAEYDLSSLRTGIMAGSLCPIEVIKEVMGKMHMQQILIAYGQTETSPVNHMTDVDDSIELRVTSVGRVGPNLEMKLINIEGEICGIGEQGEICIRGYALMHSYWNEPVKTAETIKPDGWLHSGDLGQLDSAGYLKITGRIKDMIIRGGENIYPREIEEFLYTHPDIIEVQVFGVYDKKFGEKVCAWVQTKQNFEITFKDIYDFCKGNISYFKIPEYVEFVNSFPMTVTGKMKKYEMRKVMEKRLLADA
jgi:fatty-acyl-CoA synthase